MNLTAVSTNLERVMGRALLDEAFRQQLFTEPEAAVREAGLSLSEMELEHLRVTVDRIKRDQTSEQFKHQFDGEAVRAGWG